MQHHCAAHSCRRDCLLFRIALQLGPKRNVLISPSVRSVQQMQQYCSTTGGTQFETGNSDSYCTWVFTVSA